MANGCIAHWDLGTSKSHRRCIWRRRRTILSRQTLRVPLANRKGLHRTPVPVGAPAAHSPPTCLRRRKDGASLVLRSNALVDIVGLAIGVLPHVAIPSVVENRRARKMDARMELPVLEKSSSERGRDGCGDPRVANGGTRACDVDRGGRVIDSRTNSQSGQDRKPKPPPRNSPPRTQTPDQPKPEIPSDT